MLSYRLKSNNQKHSPQRGANNGSGPKSNGISSTPSSTDDMNSALLRTTSTSPIDPNAAAAASEPSMLNNNMFGHFKGFTLKPLPNSRALPAGATNVAFVHPVAKTVEDQGVHGVPNRSAPPVPKPPQPNVPPMVANAAPALPPFNPGSTARPLISSPILEASTCSAKELISPLRHNAEKYSDKHPVRQAPAPPPVAFTVLSQARPEVISAKEPPIRDKKITGKPNSTIQRIASFLKKEDKAPKVKPMSLDKDKLKNIEISSPISTSDLSDSEPTSERSYISRTQSMREPSLTTDVVKRVNIPTFGSMRYPGGSKRPGSVVGSSRPKSPPPPRPPAPPSITNMKIPGVPGYQNPPAPKKVAFSNEYDDCEAVEAAPLAKITEDISPTHSDNIYSVIDEYQRPKAVIKSPKPVPLSSGGGGMGLLGEICNEIENRNLDSIYSVSTLNRKKGATPETHAPYVNTAEINDYGESEYTNMKSNASTTSSGYLRPSAINAPVARVAPVNKPVTETPPNKPIGNNLSSFRRKSDDVDQAKPIPVSMAVKPVNKTAGQIDKPPIATKSVISATTVQKPAPSFGRTKTPPSLQTTNKTRTRSPSPASSRKPSPAATAAKPAVIKTSSLIKPENKSIKPDVISAAIKPKPQTTTKPDVLLSKSVITTEKSGTAAYKPKWQSNSAKTSDIKALSSSSSINNSNNAVSSNKFGANRAVTATNGTTGSTGKASTIASLQQKFESAGNNKNATTTKSASNLMATTLKK